MLRRVVNSYQHHTKPTKVFVSAYASYLSIWNLDFLRLVLLTILLASKHINHSNALCRLHYSSVPPGSHHPYLHTIVKLHYHNFRPVVWVSQPFIKCSTYFKRQWDIHNSLVNAFATFLLLSYVKLLSVSIDILLPSLLWEPSYACRGPVVFYDGTLDYFGREHLPYAILAITVLLVFTLFPILLLCVYPCGWFQRLLNKYHLQRQALNTFIDAFQGSFKDGTNGTRDCRCFAALFLIIRVVAYLLPGLSLIVLSYSLLVVALLLMGVMLSLFSPYKNSLYIRFS